MSDLHIAVRMDIRLLENGSIKALINGPKCATYSLDDCLETTYLCRDGIEQGVA